MELGENAAAVPPPPVGSVVEKLVNLVEEIAATSDYRNSYKKQFSNLSRRIKLLVPMFEELKESKVAIPVSALIAMEKLNRALDLAKDLLLMGSKGSKIFLVCYRGLMVTVSSLGLSFILVVRNVVSFLPIFFNEISYFFETYSRRFYCSYLNSVSYQHRLVHRLCYWPLSCFSFLHGAAFD